MAKRSDGITHKISPSFMARLNALPDDGMVQAIVLLHVSPAPKSSKRQTGATRANAIAQTQQSAASLLTGIDAVLAAHGGERLSATPNLLGSLVVHAPRAAILALAALPTVKGVLEDQSIKPA